MERPKWENELTCNVHVVFTFRSQPSVAGGTNVSITQIEIGALTYDLLHNYHSNHLGAGVVGVIRVIDNHRERACT